MHSTHALNMQLLASSPSCIAQGAYHRPLRHLRHWGTLPCLPASQQLGVPSHHTCQRAGNVSAVQCHRRDALLALVSLPAALPLLPAPASAAAERDPGFYAIWQYATPADILPYIKEQAAPGDAQAVLDAMDTFSLYYP